MSRINVLWAIDHVCYDGNLHGGGRLYWNLLPRFDSNRFRVIPCMLRADDTIREVFSRSPVPVRVLDKGKFDLTTVATFRRLIKEEQIQVMHLHCYASSSFGRAAGWLAGIPTIIHDYDTEVYFPYPSYLGPIDRVLAPSTYAAMAASPMVERFLIERRRMEASRILTMLHAIPEEKFERPPADRIAAVRQRLGVPESTPLFGTVTKLGPQRGNELLVQAAAETLRNHEDAVFLIAYKPTLFHRLPSKKYVDVSQEDTAKETDELESLARQLGIEKKLRFVEWTEEPHELLASLDVFVAPFLSERFSSVQILEAMAMGKPVVATDLGEQAEVLEDGVQGYLVPPGDVHSLGRKLTLLAADPERRQRMGIAARARAGAYSVTASVRRLEELYQRAVDGRPPGA